MNRARTSRSIASIYQEVLGTLCGGLLLAAAPVVIQAQPAPPGPSAELCPAGAPDGDADSLCDAAEAEYGTDPGRADTDGDALGDAAELFGMMVEGVSDDGTPQLLDLPALGANPRRRDVFVEVDYFSTAIPRPEALDRVVAAFRDAPVTNPDGSTGISLHYIIDSLVVEGDDMLGDPGIPIDEAQFPECPRDDDECHDAALDGLDIYPEFDPLKAKYADPLRHGAYHYALYAFMMPNFTTGISFHLNGHDFVIALGSEPSIEEEAGTFMHELGHNLGLRHGGADHDNYKVNYLSVMNYVYEKGVIRDGVRVLDFSRHPVAALSETGVDERLGLAPGLGTTEADLERYSLLSGRHGDILLGNAGRDLDFDNSRDIATAPYDYDFNRDWDTIDVVPASQNDWEVLQFDGGRSIGLASSWTDYETAVGEVATNPPCRINVSE